LPFLVYASFSIFRRNSQLKRFKSFKEFYPYYLEEHKLPRTKLFHFMGTLGAITCLGLFVYTMSLWFVLAALFCGYGAAWISHFFIEKNKPATFKYPLYSLLGDYRMFFEILLGRHGLF
tara:strand:+ start:229 stop:585 length:357 start_codon:yes stop_codon:yes gene_type:complete